MPAKLPKGSPRWIRLAVNLQNFFEALDELLGRTVLSTDEFDQLSAAARQRAFRVHQVTNLQISQQVFDSLRDALKKGLGLSQWRRDLKTRLGAQWTSERPYLLETVFRNNIQSAYNRGRWQQMSDPAVSKYRPYWMFDAVLDTKTSPICRDHDQTIRKQDDDWWDDNYPPLHHRCRSGVRSLTERKAKRLGGVSKTKGKAPPQEGFGLSPVKSSTPEDLGRYDPRLVQQLKE